MTKKVILDDGYVFTVTDDGRIFHEDKELKRQEYSKTGYLYVGHKRRNYLVHRLVAKAFIDNTLKFGDRSIHVHHKNGDKKDNRVENLQIMFMAEHQKQHKQKYPLTKICVICGKEFAPKPTKRNRAKTCSKECCDELNKINHLKRKIPIAQKDLNGELIKIWDSASDIEKELGYFCSNINKCCKHVINTYKGFIWEYAD